MIKESFLFNIHTTTPGTAEHVKKRNHASFFRWQLNEAHQCLNITYVMKMKQLKKQANNM